MMQIDKHEGMVSTSGLPVLQLLLRIALVLIAGLLENTHTHNSKKLIGIQNLITNVLH